MDKFRRDLDKQPRWSCPVKTLLLSTVSADEKLRSFSREKKNKQKSHLVAGQSLSLPREPIRSQENSEQQQPQPVRVQSQSLPRECKLPVQFEAIDDPMAERRSRQSRRQREANAQDIRRSRSEGPILRTRLTNGTNEQNDVNTKTAPVNASDDGQAKTQKWSSDSESGDSLPRVWTRNPLSIRKTKKTEKELIENGSLERVGRPRSGRAKRSSNRDCFVYNDSTGLERHDSGSGSGNKLNKFQKLEELRNRRIEMTVTSDEEYTPETRINLLRQRVMQSKFGSRPQSGYESIPGAANIQTQHEFGKTEAVPVPSDKLNVVSVETPHSHQPVVTTARHSRLFDDNQTINDTGQKTDSAKQNGIGNSFPHSHNVRPAWTDLSRGSIDTMEVPKGSIVKLPGNIPNGGDSSGSTITDNQTKGSRSGPENHALIIQNGTKKHRSNSDSVQRDDSLDELIESNIQYLEKEMSANKPRKMPSRRASDSIFTQGKTHLSKTDMTPPPKPQRLIPNVLEQAPTQVTNEINFQIKIPPGQSAPDIRISGDHVSHFNQHQRVQQPPPSQLVLTVTPSVDNNVITSNPLDVISGNSRQIPNLRVERLSKSEELLNTEFNSPYNYSQPSSFINKLGVPTPESGMFSDMDYEVEVTDRVKMWETAMKTKSQSAEDNLKPPALTTIREKHDNLSRSISSDESIIALEEKQLRIPPGMSYSQYGQPQIGIQHPQVIAADTGTHRVFKVVQPHDPYLLQKCDSDTSVNYIQQSTPQSYLKQNLHLPLPPSQAIRRPSDSEVVRKPHRINQQSLEVSSGPGSVTSLPASMTYATTFQYASKPPPSVQKSEANVRRLPKYEEEISEISELRSDSVQNLKKVFDSDPSTPAEKNDPSSYLQPLHKVSTESLPEYNWTGILTDLQDKIKEAEVWSPSMESGHGLISVERMTARTLQTIPFSEDPVWKEIEQMTSFDSLEGSQASGMASTKTLSRQHSTSPGPQTPNQSWSGTLTSANQDPMFQPPRRAKSLYTPNIKPLTITTDQQRSAHALDDVLADIRGSIGNKPLSPHSKKEYNSDSQLLSPGRTKPNVIQHPYQPSSLAQQKIVVSYSTTAPLQPTLPQLAQPVLSTQQQQVEGGVANVNNVFNGNYQLDPLELKQKLMKTGLVDPRDQLRQKPNVIPSISSKVTSNQSRSNSVSGTVDTLASHTKSEVDQSIQDCRKLGHDIENKLSQIKSKIVSADEGKLDKILVTLRKHAPSVSPRSPVLRSKSSKDYYKSKKSKMTDALTELERIYECLDLNNESIMEGAARRDYPPLRVQDNTKSVVESLQRTLDTSIMELESEAKRVHSATKSSAVKFDSKLKPPSKTTEEEFDEISKSFEAILNEVSKPTKLQMKRQRSKTLINMTPSPSLPIESKVKSSLEMSFGKPLNQKPTIAPKPKLLSSNTLCQDLETIPLLTPAPLITSIKPRRQTINTVQAADAVLPEPVKYDCSNKDNETSDISVDSNTSNVTDDRERPVGKISSSVAFQIFRTLDDTTGDGRLYGQTKTSESDGNRGRFRTRTRRSDSETTQRKNRSKSTPRMEDATAVLHTTPRQPEKTTTSLQVNIQPKPCEPIKVNEVRQVAHRSENVTKKNCRKSRLNQRSRREETAKNRLSMPAEVLTRTVETQTNIDNDRKTKGDNKTSLKQITDGSIHNESQDSSDTSAAEKKTHKKRRRPRKPVSKLVELFSPKENSESPLSHSHSAPDLSAEFDLADPVINKPSDSQPKSPISTSAQKDEESAILIATTKIFPLSKPRPDVRRRQRNQPTQPVLDLIKAEEHVSVTTSDDAVHSPSTNKPPLYPWRKQRGLSPEKVQADSSSSDRLPSKGVNVDNAVPGGQKNVVGTDTKAAEKVVTKLIRTPEIQRRQRRNSDSMNREREFKSDNEALERSSSFNELLAAFEPDSKRAAKLKDLRKCSSEDNVTVENVLHKTYHSDPDMFQSANKSSRAVSEDRVSLTLDVDVKP